MISAREQSIPVTYVAGLYAQAPVAIISLPKADITRPGQLKGKKVGLPGRFGSSYIGLLGALNRAGLTEKDVDIQEIGFNQAPQLLAGKVDAVLGYANNDALQVQAQANAKPNVIQISDVIPFIGTGLITNDETLKSNDKLVQGMARAMLTWVGDRSRFFRNVGIIADTEPKIAKQTAKVPVARVSWRGLPTTRCSVGRSRA